MGYCFCYYWKKDVVNRKWRYRQLTSTMQEWHDSDTYEGEQFSGEKDFGEIVVAQSSGGRTSTTDSARVRVEEKFENGSWCIYSASRWNTALPSAWQKPKRTWCALSGKAARFDFVLFKRPRFAFYDSKCFWNRMLYRTFSCSDPQILSLNTMKLQVKIEKKVVH